MKITRRHAGRLLLTVPLAAASAGAASQLLGTGGARAAEEAAEKTPEPTPLAKFLAKQEDGLSSAEKDRVRREVTQIEESLKTLREFKMSNDVPPAGTFRAMRSKRAPSGGR